MKQDNQLAPGVYEALLTNGLRNAISRLPDMLEPALDVRPDSSQMPEHLARQLSTELTRLLRAILKEDAVRDPNEPVRIVNSVLTYLSSKRPDSILTEARVAAPAAILRGIRSREPGAHSYPEPLIPLSQSALLVNDNLKLAAGTIIKREIASADGVDLICAFVNYRGVLILEDEIRSLVHRGAMRLITTTYMGATQKRALDALCSWGVQIKVVYELPPANTRLHAKAWLFSRASGFNTASIGSSNLSPSALMDGLEWNVRLTQVDTPSILASFQATFDRYWADPCFEEYNPERDGARLNKALGASQGAALDDRLDFFLDVQPWPHQKEILEALEAERTLHNKWSNLVVAATGTGKTIVAALDYKRLREKRGDLTLLFVAHRHEILDQARSAFRHVLRDGSFGERWERGEKPSQWRYVFASIQTLSHVNLDELRPDLFQMVVIDEFHH
ncbi:MAG TPA: DEAD/DEAH box helicase family protein, partial [Chthonomonadales bacterium]|nr:DEAD/DEAH box helicase family protein [Chthonomonadales bacterium]